MLVWRRWTKGVVAALRRFVEGERSPEQPSARPQRQSSTHWSAYAYTGETAAHNAIAVTEAAVQAFTQLVAFGRSHGPRGAYIRLLDEALAWWADANETHLDRTTRWIRVVAMQVHLDLIDAASDAHEGTPLEAPLRAAGDALATLLDDLYTEEDHLLRLNAQGFLSDHALRERLATAPLNQRRPGAIGADLRALRAAMASASLE